MHGYLKRSLSDDCYKAAMIILKAQRYNEGFKAKKICKARSEGTKITWVPFDGDEDRKTALLELKSDNEMYQLKYGTTVLKFEDPGDEENEA